MVSPRNTKKRNLPFVVDYVRGHATHRVDIFFAGAKVEDALLRDWATNQESSAVFQVQKKT